MRSSQDNSASNGLTKARPRESRKIMGAIIDRFGLFGVDQIAISPARALGIALLGIGAALSLVR